MVFSAVRGNTVKTIYVYTDDAYLAIDHSLGDSLIFESYELQEIYDTLQAMGYEEMIVSLSYDF